MGYRPSPRWREALRDHSRCQAMGGARARNSAACDAVRSNSAASSSRNRPKTVGSGNDGISAGTNAPARWISVQIGQRSSARRSRPAGPEGALRSSADGCTLASALAPDEAGAMRSRCTWANETASWNASANSARYAPNLERDRNQRIVVTLRASRSRQNHSTAPFENFSYNVILATIRPFGDSSDVLQKNIKMCGRERGLLMTKTLSALVAAVTFATAVSAMRITADARCVGCAVGASERPADAPPGYVYYPAYGEPLPGPNCYWYRTPVYDTYGKMVGWRGRPVAFCSWLAGFRPWPPL